jgi:hypothetical protein
VGCFDDATKASGVCALTSGCQLCEHHEVRTTLTLDEDVAKLLRREMRRSGASLKAVVNQFLRIGLTSSGKSARRRFVVHPRPMGLHPGLSYDNVEELLASLEGPSHK